MLYLLIFLILPIKCSELVKIIGVPVHHLPLYSNFDIFTCFDGSLTVPISFVNDDYCDCADGSDEPGTSACSNGQFYCENKGYIGLTITSSFVNDGICDCCDGSDEWVSGNCTDYCDILSAQAKAEEERLNELKLKGVQLRLEMVANGKTIRESKITKANELKVEQTIAEEMKNNLEETKKVAEEKESAALEVYRQAEERERLEREAIERAENEKEAMEAFKYLDSNEDGKIDITEIKVRKMFDRDNNGEVTEEEWKSITVKEDVTWEEFLETAWLQIKPLYMLEKGIFIPPDKDLQEELKKRSEEIDDEQKPKIDDIKEEGVVEERPVEENVEEFKEPEEGHYDEEDDEDKHEHDYDAEEGTEDEHREEPVQQSIYDEETQKLIDFANQARSKFDEADRQFKDIERQIIKIQDSLSKDFGPEDEFLPLYESCFTYTDREYIYKLCPFDQVIQSSRSGGSETRLGVWEKWDKPLEIMSYENGQSCWNGPQRSTKVHLLCGLENEVISASEPSRCEYVLEFTTPAACKLPGKSDSKSGVEHNHHDEL